MAEGLPSRVLRGLSRRTRLRIFRVFDRPLGSAAVDCALALKRMEAAEMLRHCAEPDLDLREDAVRAAYARGDVCVAAFDGAALAGYCWFAFAPLHHLDGVWVEFGPHASWTYKSLVRPAYRGRGIAPALYRFADAACRERGRTTSLLCVEEHNAPSVMAALRAGYAPSGRAAYRRGAALHAWHSEALRRNGVRFRLP